MADDIEMTRIAFRDPLRGLLEREAQTCKGCIHSKVMLDRRYCNKGKKHGKRCKQYDDKGK